MAVECFCQEIEHLYQVEGFNSCEYLFLDNPYACLSVVVSVITMANKVLSIAKCPFSPPFPGSFEHFNEFGILHCNPALISDWYFIYTLALHHPWQKNKISDKN